MSLRSAASASRTVWNAVEPMGSPSSGSGDPPARSDAGASVGLPLVPTRSGPIMTAMRARPTLRRMPVGRYRVMYETTVTVGVIHLGLSCTSSVSSQGPVMRTGASRSAMSAARPHRSLANTYSGGVALPLGLHMHFRSAKATHPARPGSRGLPRRRGRSPGCRSYGPRGRPSRRRWGACGASGRTAPAHGPERARPRRRKATGAGGAAGETGAGAAGPAVSATRTGRPPWAAGPGCPWRRWAAGCRGRTGSGSAGP